MKRYALLDTDFISKTHSVQNDGGNHLIDRVMELPGYKFFCHAQIVTELNRYNADAPIWLSEKIGAKKIKSYTDQEIKSFVLLQVLSVMLGEQIIEKWYAAVQAINWTFGADYSCAKFYAKNEISVPSKRNGGRSLKFSCDLRIFTPRQ